MFVDVFLMSWTRCNIHSSTFKSLNIEKRGFFSLSKAVF